MSVFETYARYYDLLYADKDYQGEANYVDNLIQRFKPGAACLLDAGCGTGRHARFFSELGYEVVGMDRSDDMISNARQGEPGIRFERGDICDFDLKSKYDVVVALFHVMSYLTRDNDLHSAFEQIGKHLKPGGLLIFDCWHGPAVLHERPEVRVKRLQKGNTQLVRIAEPSMNMQENRVDVNFQVFVHDDEEWDSLSETHSMRYLFPSEIDKLLSLNGMNLLCTEEWLSAKTPGENTWSVVYVAQLQ